MIIGPCNTTELVFILDKSGSMCGLEKDTIGGFNSLIEKQRKEEGTAYVTTVLFSDNSTVIHDRKNLNEIKNLTDKEYYVGGCTALLDAIGDTIHYVDEQHKKLTTADCAKMLFVITTDGMENASREYNYEKVKSLIEERKEWGWEFLFLGANIDAIETASRFGIEADKAVRYKCDSKGVDINYDCLSQAVTSIRKTGRVNKKWKAGIAKDYAEREGK